jgi:hypothetical protein
MTKRYILALTRAEIGTLRSALAIEVENGTLRGPEGTTARRAIAKIDAAESVTDVDLDALDWCAGNILDTGDGVTVLKEHSVKGDPYRARDVLRRAMKGQR